LAGPAMNYLLAFILFVLVAAVWGTLRPSDQPVVGEVIPGLPAAQFQLKSGDRIAKINGQNMATWDQMARFIHDKPNQKLHLEVERPQNSGRAQRLEIDLTPRRDPQQGIGLIGIMPRVD